MSSAEISSAHAGDLNILIYDYVKKGDALAMHVHDVAGEHIIIVARGEIVLRIENPADRTVAETSHEAGAIIDTFAGWPHEVVGTVDNSRTIHIPKRLAR